MGRIREVSRRRYEFWHIRHLLTARYKKEVHEEEEHLHIHIWIHTEGRVEPNIYITWPNKSQTLRQSLRQIRDPKEEEEPDHNRWGKETNYLQRSNSLKPREEAQLRMVRQKFSIYNRHWRWCILHSSTSSDQPAKVQPVISILF